MQDTNFFIKKNETLIHNQGFPHCPNCNIGTNKVVCPINGLKRKRHSSKNDENFISICTADLDLIKSSRLFKAHFEMLSDLSSYIVDQVDAAIVRTKAETSVILHNIRHLNAHNIQEIYALIPQASLGGGGNAQKEAIATSYSQNKSEFANAILRILKNIQGIKGEFAVYEKLLSKTASLDARVHEIFRVTQNVKNIFYHDFDELRLRVLETEFYDHALIDYDIVIAALYHIFHNAMKYCASGTDFVVRYSSDSNYIYQAFDMVSLKIDADEIQRIFEQGYSGRLATKHKLHGAGIGMSVVKIGMEAIGGSVEISINANPQLGITRDGKKYENNIFKLCYPKPQMK